MADTFRGDNAHLCECIDALLSLDASGSMAPHGVGVHARTLLESASTRLRALSPAGGPELADVERRFLSVRDMLPGDYITGYTEALAHIRAAMLAASPQQEPGAGELCKTCGGHGVVCYHTGQTPEQYEEHTEDCPDCTPRGQTLAGAGGELIGYVWPNEADYDRIHRCFGSDGDPLVKRVPSGAIPVIAATSAGTTGDDSEDAARYRWLRTCGVADDRAIHTRGYSELLSESALDAAIDARRARGDSV